MNTNRFILVNEARKKIADIDRDLAEIKSRCFDSNPITRRAALMEHVGRLSGYIEDLINYRDNTYDEMQLQVLESTKKADALK